MLRSELPYCRKYMIVSYIYIYMNILKFRQASRIVKADSFERNCLGLRRWK